MRKAQEIRIAYWLEKQLSKDAILTLYLNRVYLGSGNYGVEAAAQFYFGRHAKDVTLAEAAMLAGLPKAPTRLAPTKNLNLAQARARRVLDAMVEAGFIKSEEATLALAKPAAPAETEARDAANYFVDWASEELWSIAEGNEAAGWRDKNLIVQTTYDPVLQIKAELAVMNGLDNEAQASRVSQAALVALDPTGAVRAMVGGRAYAESQFNRATQALRQPGSAFKPFVYLTALEQGIDPNTVMFDGPISVEGWSPQNYDGGYQGQVTLVQALAHSINTVAVQVSEQAGRQNVIDTAHRLGITEEMDPLPSIALGTTEVTVLELAGAYLPFVNDGYPEHPYGIVQVKTDQGDVLYNRAPETGERVIASRYVALMNYMLDQVMEEGTGRGALLADGRPAAGKTGTSQDNRDAWFVGFTPQLLTAVWVGNDDVEPHEPRRGRRAFGAHVEGLHGPRPSRRGRARAQHRSARDGARVRLRRARHGRRRRRAAAPALLPLLLQQGLERALPGRCHARSVDPRDDAAQIKRRVSAPAGLFSTAAIRPRLACKRECEAAMPLIVDHEKARQGHTGDGVRYVLSGSLALAVLAMILLVLSFASG